MDQWVYDKGSKAIQLRKDSPVNKCHWENWTATYKECKQYLLTSYTKKTSKWIKDLNVRPETTELLQGNRGRQFPNSKLTTN